MLLLFTIFVLPLFNDEPFTSHIGHAQQLDYGFEMVSNETADYGLIQKIYFMFHP
jgi:hypothetical protein